MSESPRLGRLIVESGESRWRLRLAGYGTLTTRHGEPAILGLSAIGPDTAVKALRGVLVDKKCQATLSLSDTATGQPEPAGRDTDGYQCHITRLIGSPPTYQLVATTKREGLLLNSDDEGLWMELTCDRFSTPLLRSWMPWVRHQLVAQNLLRTAEGFGPQSQYALLLANSKHVDTIVSDGVRDGNLELTE